MMRCAFCDALVAVPCGAEHEMPASGQPACLAHAARTPLALERVLHASIIERLAHAIRDWSPSNFRDRREHRRGHLGATVQGARR